MEKFHRYHLPMPEGSISDTGVREIERFMGRQRPQDGTWKEVNPESTNLYLPSLPDDWQWLWKVMRGEYRGTFPKRAAQYFWKRYGLKCPESFLTELGALARRYTGDGAVYAFEFDSDFHWSEGEFGDDGACLYTQYPGAFEMLRVNGAVGMCFYEPGTDHGMARAFTFNTGAYHLVWNGYGFSGDPTLRIAQIFAAWRGKDEQIKKIRLTNHGYYPSALQVNDGGHGYAVATPDVLESLDLHEFGWSDIYMRYCEGCDDLFRDDEVSTGPDDNYYCDRCESRLFGYCDVCDHAHYHEDLTYVDDQDVCQWCLQNHYTTCDQCGEYVHRRETHRRGGDEYCLTCYQALPTPKTK
jgi:hypothetical protein